jgi:ABC-type transport system substrate-binding protein
MRSIHARPEIAALAAALLGACSSPLAAPRGHRRDIPTQRGGTITVAQYVNVRSVDPAVAFDEGSDPIVRLLFARLLRVSESGAFEGEIARSFRVTDDGLRVLVQLHPGVRFHDGTLVSARDVKRSIERALHPDTPCPAPSFFDRLVGFDDYRQGKTDHIAGVVASSDVDIEFRLREPDATFLATLTLPFASPVCPSAGATFDPSFSVHACGAGPFRLVRWQDQDAIVLARHEGYFEPGLPYLDGITWLFGMQTTTQRFQFEQGRLDYVHELSAADSAAFRSDPRWAPFGAWNEPRSTRGIFMNTRMPPFDRLEIRQAVAAAIDREQVGMLRAGTVVPARSMVPPGVVGHDPDFQGQRFDLQRALDLMHQAGFAYDPATGRGGYPDPIDYFVSAESFEVQAAELYQQHLARIGIRIRLRSMAWTAWLAQTGRPMQAPMGGDGWSADFDDPSNFFDPIFSTGAIQDDESQNRAFFSNAELDDVLARGRREMSPVVRRALYRRADEIVRDQAPWAVVFGYRYYDVWQPYLHGYRPHPRVQQRLAFVWLDIEEKRRALRAKNAPPGSLNVLALALSRRPSP